MAFVLSDNIISPLGFTSADNYLSVKAGKSGIQTYAPGSHGIPEGFTASLIGDDMVGKLYADKQEMQLEETIRKSRFGLLAFSSAYEALKVSGVDVERQKVVFILSTTKGAIEEMVSCNQVTENPQQVTENLPQLAQQIALALGIRSQAIVVCNACISGLSAIILANRLLDAGEYDTAVVCGADCPGKFIISGFLSLKATSTVPCRPFDMDRFGLNLGEAAATLVLGRDASLIKGNVAQTPTLVWNLRNGYIKNDAFHVTSPAKDAVGLYHALMETLEGVNVADLAFVNAHGTATLFNDQMESVAIEKAGLSLVPTNALKSYFGHTLGAAGILETIISLHAAGDAMVLGTRGFEELGVSGKLNMSSENRKTDKTSFVKMLSGFGGCNASILAELTECKLHSMATTHLPFWQKTHNVRISPEGAWVDGNFKEKPQEGDFVTHLYKLYVGSYPKYYKMDALSRLGFVASELLLAAEGGERFLHRGDRAIVLCNRSSSISSDRKYVQSICDEDNYFPSPSVFVYTLPNIVTGEIAIRNGYQGETSFYLLSNKNEEQMKMLVDASFADAETKSVLGGWLDYEDETHYEAEFFIAECNLYEAIVSTSKRTSSK